MLWVSHWARAWVSQWPWDWAWRWLSVQASMMVWDWPMGTP